MWRFVCRKMMGISPRETQFQTRGFRSCAPAQQERLETVGLMFLEGYHAAIEQPFASLPQALDRAPIEYRGFVYEGAAMALTILDALPIPGGGRLKSFLANAGEPHAYMVHVGAGWAFARLPLLRNKIAHGGGFDPLLFPLLLDGYGFHEGYFHPKNSIEAGTVPKGLSRREQNFFDQGLGRSLWFVQGTDPESIAFAIQRLAPDRRGDLWGGVGLACAYAGAVRTSVLEDLKALSGDSHIHLAQGAAFAAQARRRAGNTVPHTHAACEVLCRMGANQAADLTMEMLDQTGVSSGPDRYREWQIRLREKYRVPTSSLAAAR